MAVTETSLLGTLVMMTFPWRNSNVERLRECLGVGRRGNRRKTAAKCSSESNEMVRVLFRTVGLANL